MPEIKFDGWFASIYNCFIISNTGSDNAYEINARSFTNPQIDMLLPECSDSDLAKFCDAKEFPDNPLEFKENLVQILRGRSPAWRLTGISIDVAGGISLCYASRNKQNPTQSDKVYNSGHVIADVFYMNLISLPLIFEFKIFHAAEGYTERYKINMNISIDECLGKLAADQLNAHIEKFVSEYRIYELDMREDNHGLEANDDMQYYTGKLYL